MQQAEEQVVEIVTNADDITGEVAGDACQRLLEAGALDVWTTPITMKQNRPGVMISLLVPAKQAERFGRLLIQLTGTFGVRYRTWERMVLQREQVVVQTPFGPMRRKVGRLDGRVVSCKWEFADIRKAAEERGTMPRAILDELASWAERECSS